MGDLECGFESQTGFEFWFCHSLSEWFVENCLTILASVFYTCKMGDSSSSLGFILCHGVPESPYTKNLEWCLAHCECLSQLQTLLL